MASWKRIIEPCIYHQKEDLKNDLENDPFFLHLVTVFPPINASGAYFISKLQRCDTYWRGSLIRGSAYFKARRFFLIIAFQPIIKYSYHCDIQSYYCRTASYSHCFNLCKLMLYALYFSYTKILVIFSISNQCLILSCNTGDRTLIRGNMVYTNRRRLCGIILLGTKI